MYRQRQQKAIEWLRNHKIDAAFIRDETHVLYLTGMPYGSILFLFSAEGSVLVPWDSILADKIAVCDEIIPYTDFDRSLETAYSEILKKHNLSENGRIEIPVDISHLQYEKLAGIFPENEIICRKDGLDDFILTCRMTKDDTELDALRRAAVITDELLDELVDKIKNGTDFIETDIALFLESEARKRGAQGMGFETIVAGPSRSFGIHAFPAYTGDAFAAPGMSILDFGVKVEGYTSDITFSVIRGKTTTLQEKMITLVEDAYNLAAGMVKPGVDTFEIAHSVDRHFAQHGFTMPHALGHGIGLNVHEAPALRNREGDGTILEPGMIFTIEPGLYHPDAGGVRVENDFLVTKTGSEVITNSHILRIQ